MPMLTSPYTCIIQVAVSSSFLAIYVLSHYFRDLCPVSKPSHHEIWFANTTFPGLHLNCYFTSSGCSTCFTLKCDHCHSCKPYSRDMALRPCPHGNGLLPIRWIFYRFGPASTRQRHSLCPETVFFFKRVPKSKNLAPVRSHIRVDS